MRGLIESGGTMKLRTMHAGLAALAALSATTAAQAQSEPPKLQYITPEDAERLFAGTQAKAVRIEKDTEVEYEVTLNWGLKLNAELQNCEDKARALKCRTLSIIANFGAPKGASRKELLEMVNRNNKRDVYGRAFLNDGNQIIVRMASIVSGQENLLNMAHKFAGWQYHLNRFYFELYDEKSAAP